MSYLQPNDIQKGLQDSHKKPVRLASTANVNLAGTLTALDLISLNDGDRVLLKNQSTASENGIYTWSSSTQMLTRSRDGLSFDSACRIAVQEGTVNSNTAFLLDTNNPIVVGSSGLTFSLVDGGGAASLSAVLAVGNTSSGSDLVISAGDQLQTPVAILPQSPQPSTAAGQGALWVDDGGAQVAGGIYHRAASDGIVTRLDLKREHFPVANHEEVDGTASTAFLGAFPFNPLEWGPERTFTLVVTLSVSDVALTGTVILRNLTDIEDVTIGAISTSSTSPVKLTSGALTVGSAAGNLKDSEKLYEVRITNDGVNLSDKTFLGVAYMLIE